MIEPAQFLVFILQPSDVWTDELIAILEEKWGELRHKGSWQAFDQTHYYAPEMGQGLYRAVASFHKEIDPSDIVQIKLDSIALENEYRSESGRRFNLDVGYMDADKVVLPSCKKGPWKVYSGKGIWLDIVLHYAKGDFTGTPWAFEDFVRNPYQHDLRLIREKHRKSLRSQRKEPVNSFVVDYET